MQDKAISRESVFIIAEAGVNHNGSLALAKQLVDVAANSGADAVKFQTFKAERLVGKTAEKAEYQKRMTNSGESQFEMLKRLELSEDTHLELDAHCKSRGIMFLSTPFDAESMDFLVRQARVPLLKMPSGEITNAPLLLRCARSGLPVILSTGMATLDEVRDALGVLAFGYIGGNDSPSLSAFRSAFEKPEAKNAIGAKIRLLHCTTEYPAPFEDVNLNAMATLREAFGLPVGYSDHTEGISVPLAAVALGACVIEKHFTLDRGLEGPDHGASIEPAELAAMVRGIRQVEKALGSSGKSVAPSEAKNIPIARKSLVASRAVKKGEKFSEENLSAKRPGSGVSPMRYWEFLGKTAERNLAENEALSE